MGVRKRLDEYMTILSRISEDFYLVQLYGFPTILNVNFDWTCIEIISYFTLERSVSIFIDALSPKKWDNVLDSLLKEAEFVKRALKDYTNGEIGEQQILALEEQMLEAFNKILKPTGKEFKD